MKIGILGAGIAGLTTAIALHKIGLESIVLEAAEVIKPVGAGLGLGANAIKAFKKLGIAQEVMEAGQLLSAFRINDRHGKVITHTNSVLTSQKYGPDNFVIHRAALHEVLLSHVPSDRIHLNKKGVRFEYVDDRIKVYFSDQTTELFDYLIVADGIHSSIRQQLLPGSKPRYAGYTCWRAVIDYSDYKVLEAFETWGINGRFGAVPLPGNSVYWFACVNASANDPKMKAITPADLALIFKNYHAPIPNLLAQTPVANLIWSDISDLVPLKKYAFENVLLIGDAAHATTPNLGQGACQAIEDAVILANEIVAQSDIPKAFTAFEAKRVPRTHFIINQSRLLGRVAQADNRLSAALRNFLLRALPDSFNEKQLEKLYKVEF